MTENMLRNYIRCFNSNRWKYPASFFDLTPIPIKLHDT